MLSTKDIEERLCSLDITGTKCIPYQGEYIPARITKIGDGDTISCIILVGDYPLSINIRIIGIDAPEITLKKGVTPLEKSAGLAVKKYVESLFRITEIITIKLIKIDKYGGRYVGDIKLAQGTLSQHLLDIKVVKPYGGGTKGKWSEDELNGIISYFKCTFGTPFIC